MLKLITKKGQLPKGVLEPELPIVLNVETNEFYKLKSKGVLVKDESYRDLIPVINRNSSKGIKSLTETLTGVEFSEDSFVDEFFEHVRTNVGTVNDDFYKLFSAPSTISEFFRYLEVTRRLSRLIKSSKKYPIHSFDCDRSESTERILHTKEFKTDLEGYRCLIVGVRGGLKAVVDVMDTINTYTLAIKVKSVVGNEGRTSGYIIPLYKLEQEPITLT